MEHDTCTSSSSTKSDVSSINENEICKKLISNKKCKRCYYVCLGTLIQIVQTQIQRKYAENDYLYLIGKKCITNLNDWATQWKSKKLLASDFLKPFITSIALFAVGVKLTSELVAWKVM
ncbi:uncharacterized protein LOC143145191 [Ptiloglossa arizonensis]|uniref:uncharacterized protein LOC143145191 n=1 Tax=Ptiloglossa arizonensis TaxID=3350558 RepID=UPI003FA053CE